MQLILRALGSPLSLLLPCLLLSLQAGCATHPSTASALRRLQGTWEGVLLGQEKDGKITTTITGNSLHFHRDTNFWFATTFRLPAGTAPQQLHATIKDDATSDTNTIGQVISTIFKIEDGTLTLTLNQFHPQQSPKSFEAIQDEGIIRYEFRKVRPQKRNAVATSQ